MCRYSSFCINLGRYIYTGIIRQYVVRLRVAEAHCELFARGTLDAFRGEFGIIQIQALCRGSVWRIPSSRALQAAVAYVNRHSKRGGVQALVSIVERKVTTFWRSWIQEDVQVIIRSADVPLLRMRLNPTSGDTHRPGESMDMSKVVVSLPDEGAVRQYLTQAVAKLIIPSIGTRASFRRLLLHICISGKTC